MHNSSTSMRCAKACVNRAVLFAGWLFTATILPAFADLPQTIERVKPSIVGVGTFQGTRNPKVQFRGTGFVVADGTYVVTNGHVVPPFLDVDSKEIMIVLVGRGQNAQQP
jgi:S1-C subfamily serine protease